jgi:hypothetical protein
VIFSVSNILCISHFPHACRQKQMVLQEKQMNCLPTTVQYKQGSTLEQWDAAKSLRNGEADMPPMEVNLIFRKDLEIYIQSI